MESFYIVATPIGNLEDITLRALRILKEVDFIVCEDTRVSSKLLQKYGISKPLFVYNDHSTEKVRQKIITMLGEKQKGALISDAGTPLISDPGYKLVRSLRDSGFTVTSIPGASSIITALSIGNLPTDKFAFVGYLPPKAMQRQKDLLKMQKYEGTIIVLETSKKIVNTLHDLLGGLGNRIITIARELTKLHEEVITDNIQNLINKYSAVRPKGEIVILISGYVQEDISEDSLIEEIKSMLDEYSAKDLSAFLAEKYSISKKYVYDLVKVVG